jgi:hypothetical protein
MDVAADRYTYARGVRAQKLATSRRVFRLAAVRTAPAVKVGGVGIVPTSLPQ